MAKATHSASDLLKMGNDEEAPKRKPGRPKKDTEASEPKTKKPAPKKKTAKPSPVALKVQISETGDTTPMKTVKVSEDAIKNAVAAQVADSMFQSSNHYEPSDQQVEEQEHVAQMAAPNEEDFDIFTDLGEVRAEKGNILLYEIYRNNQLVHSVEHPYSWAQILSEIAAAHGGGRYKVRAKDPDQSYRYVRHQQKLIANPKKRPETQNAQQQPAQVMRDSMSEAPKMDIADLSVKLMDNNRQMLREAMDMAQSSRSQQDPSTEILKTVLTSFTSMMAAKSAPPPRDDGKFELAIEKISGSFERALDKVLGQVEKLSDKIAQLEKAPTVAPAMDPLTLIKMMEDAKRDGIESHREILAEAREMMEETAARGEAGQAEPKSAWEKALEIGMGALARTAAMQAAQQPRIPQRRAAYAPTPALPTATQQTVQGAVPAQAAAPAQAATPRAPQGAESAAAKPKKPFKIQLVEFMTPRITAHITEGKTPEESAEMIRGELAARKVTSRHIVKAISKEELTTEAAPLGAEIVAWLAKFHDNMKDHADSTLQSPPDTANAGAGAQQAS